MRASNATKCDARRMRRQPAPFPDERTPGRPGPHPILTLRPARHKCLCARALPKVALIVVGFCVPVSQSTTEHAEAAPATYLSLEPCDFAALHPAESI